MAAGLTIQSENLDALRARLNELARHALKPEDLQAPLRLDAEIALKDIAIDRLEELDRLKPMGQGNVVLATRAHVQRYEAAAMPGWYGIAATFDDVQFDRDDRMPSRYLAR